MKFVRGSGNVFAILGTRFRLPRIDVHDGLESVFRMDRNTHADSGGAKPDGTRSHGSTPSKQRCSLMAEQTDLDFDRLFKLRLVIARHGEMDAARWWNTQGMLGRRGRIVLRRGFPSTHHFVRARVVFEVAKSRCQEIFDPPRCMTLWSLPAELEEQFQEHWQGWLDETDKWAPVFQTVEAQSGGDLLKALGELDLLSQSQFDTVAKLRRSAEKRAVPISGTFQPNDNIITLLAAGFTRGEAGNPAIPYARPEA